jgi:hypothetical protein
LFILLFFVPSFQALPWKADSRQTMYNPDISENER